MSLKSLSICTATAFLLISCRPVDLAAEPELAPPVVVPERGVFVELDRAAVRLSPDGRQIAFLAPLAGVDNLWLAPVADMAAAKSLTQEEKQPIARFWWTYSGAHLIVQQPDADGKRQLSLLTLADGERRTLTPAAQDADLVHLSPSEPQAAMVTVTGAEDGLADLYELDLLDGTLELVAENERFVSWGVDEDLDLRLAFEPTEDGGMRVRQQGEMGEWVDFSWVPTRDVPHTRFLGFDRSARVAYFVDSRGRSAGALVASNVTTGDARVLFQDPTADVADILLHPVRKTVQAVVAARAQRQWRVLDEAVRPDLEVLQGLGAGDLEIVDRSLDDRVWLAAVVPFDGPRRFYRYDRTNRETELLFAGRPGEVAEVAEVETPVTSRPSAQ